MSYLLFSLSKNFHYFIRVSFVLEIWLIFNCFFCLFVCFLFFSGHPTLETAQFGFHVFCGLRESFFHHVISRDREPGWFLQDVSQCLGIAAVPRSE